MQINQIFKPALENWTTRYLAFWMENFSHEPKSESLYGLPSLCITKTQSGEVFWLPQKPEDRLNFSIVEEVMQMQLNPAIWSFYCTQYAGDMRGRLNEEIFTLIQVWNNEDFGRLEQNIIAHLTMLKKQKKTPNVFIATTEDESELIVIDNITGNIEKINLVTNQSQILADNLGLFLSALIPIA